MGLTPSYNVVYMKNGVGEPKPVKVWEPEYDPVIIA